MKFPLVEIETYFPIRFIMCTDIETLSIQRKGYMTKVQVKNIFYPELSIKPNVGILGIKVSMWKQYDFGTIFTSNDVMNIQYSVGKGFGSI